MDVKPYLNVLHKKNASELVLMAGSSPHIILAGEQTPISKTQLTPQHTKAAALKLMNPEHVKSFKQHKQVSFVIEHDFGEFDVGIQAKDQNIQISFKPKTQQKTAVKPTSAPKPENSQPKKVKTCKDYNPPRLPDDPELIESQDLFDYLRLVIKHDASDLFVTSDSQIKTKLNGRAIPLSEFVVTPEISEQLVYSIMDEDQIAQFNQSNDLDFAIAMPDDSGRFRVNAFRQRRKTGIVMRLIPSEIPTAKQLGLPPILTELIMNKRGLLLMVGGTGSGKSTTLAAMIDYRNENQAGHILTIEDPVEFSHPNKMSILNQREVGVDTDSYASAIKASLREAPDVILIGEIRTMETMEAALELANTGHLCISTLHANNANQAMERCINMFPTDKHRQLFMDLSANLRAVISQRLIPDVNNKRVAAIEVMINTPHISDLIAKGSFKEIKEAMANSGAKGMKTFDDALYDLHKAKRITKKEAISNADSPNDLDGRIAFG